MLIRPHEQIPEPWLSFLRALDSSVHEQVRLDCMGGFVVTIVYGFSRATGDLDVLKIAQTEAGQTMLALGARGGPLHKKYKIYLDRVGVAKVPEVLEPLFFEPGKQNSGRPLRYDGRRGLRDQGDASRFEVDAESTADPSKEGRKAA